MPPRNITASIRQPSSHSALRHGTSALALLLLAGGVHAQGVLHSFAGEASGDALGMARSVGDTNADGRNELVLGAPQHDGAGDAAGQARLVDGDTGATLFTWDGTAAGEYLGRSVSGIGDIDLDGTPDVLVGAPGAPGSTEPGTVRVFSGATGALLLEVDGSQAGGSFGYSVSGAGDLDQDGTPDLLVGAPGEDHAGLAGAGRVHALSGVDGSSLAVLGGHAAGDAFGRVVDGAWWASADGGAMPPIGATVGGMDYIEVFDNTFASQFLAASPGLGFALGRLEDVDGDGVLEVLAGSWSQGRLLVLSGADGSLLLDERRDPASSFGYSVCRAGDIDADGVPDIAVGAPADDTIFVISGADGSDLQSHTNGVADTYGWSLDFGGENYVAVGSPLADSSSTNAGRVDMLELVQN